LQTMSYPDASTRCIFFSEHSANNQWALSERSVNNQWTFSELEYKLWLTPMRARAASSSAPPRRRSPPPSH
jgi:hypothetical protein